MTYSFNEKPKTASPVNKWLDVARFLIAGVAATLIACGGGGVTTDNGVTGKTTISNLGVVSVGQRPLPPDFFDRRAVAYSPFRSNNRDTETITDAMVKQDLDLMAAAGLGVIRLFDSSEKVAERTLRLINTHKIDIKVMLGAYINSTRYVTDPATKEAIDLANNEEMARCVALANSYPHIVKAVSVGNETMVSWSFVKVPTVAMAANIKRVRDQISQPVTTDDNWAFYAGYIEDASYQPSEVFAQIDFVSIHTYPVLDIPFSDFSDTDVRPDWDWKQLAVPQEASARAFAMMDAAIEKTKKDYAAARAYLDAKGKASLPIVIGETGWMAVDPSGKGLFKFQAHPVNQKMYYDRLLAWGDAAKGTNGPKGIVYFEAFDEPWKGSDDKWGLFNVDRQARFVIQGKNPASSSWIYEPVLASDVDRKYTDADALYFKPPTLTAALTTNRYTIYADTPVTGEVRPGLVWDAFDGSTVTRNENDTTTFAPGDGTRSLSIVPKPLVYGWGLLYHSSADINENLSAFAATGRINFSIKTDYIGKIKIGVGTDTEDRRGAEANILLSNGDYGYCNTGAWCNVSIPLSAFVAVNPKLDLRYVLSRFIISDVYTDTGNTPGQTRQLNIDSIFWSK
jgi:exo-beta-1,3-glucanase (GH17 family)